MSWSILQHALCRSCLKEFLSANRNPCHRYRNRPPTNGDAKLKFVNGDQTFHIDAEVVSDLHLVKVGGSELQPYT